MVIFEIERIDRIVRDIEKAMYKDSEMIKSYRVCPGNFPGGEKPELEDSTWGEYRTGDLWGGYDVHQWFRGDIVIPESFKGENVIFKVTTGHEGEWDALNPQILFYLDGKMLQGLDVNHREVVVSECGEPGRRYSIALLAYSGLNEPKTILTTEICVLDRLIEDIYYNIKVPLLTAKLLGNDNDNRINILNKLGTAVDMIDLRKIYSEDFYKSIKAANEYLVNEFYTKVDYDCPVVTALGHTHIDIAWLWTISQTKEKAVRSFSTVINLMKQYPEYRFMSSQPQLYEYIKENATELYEEIKEMIKEGRWEADGGMWLEADCNISSGESLIRQILFGNRFFMDEFGVKSRTLWLPDVFGYSAALPQIIKKSGMDYFMTTKISWSQFNSVPNDTFMWKGIDGTEVFTHFVTTSDYSKGQGENITFSDKKNTTTYTGIINPNQVMGTWKRYQNKEMNNETLMLFGYGDGGGGPTKDMLENAKRLKYGIPGCPRLQIGFEGDYFDRLYERVKDLRELPKWAGELYLEYHRGTYTSMSRSKRYNRKSEFLYQDGEMLSTLNMVLGEKYPGSELKKGWKTILLNQFHDIIPGSSIKEVYEESYEQYEDIIKEGQDIVKNTMRSIASKIDLHNKSIIVFNTLSYDRSDIAAVELSEGTLVQSLEDSEGKAVDIQLIENGKKLVFFAENVPSKGYKSFKIIGAGEASRDEAIHFDKNFENRYFKVIFDENYNIESLYDKENEREVIKKNSKGNVLQAFEDRPMQWENWDIDIYYKRKLWEVNDLQKAEMIEFGPVRYCIKLERSFCDSKIEQYIYFYNDIPRIDFRNCVDWREKNILLKAAFPVDINSSKATYEIQYGNLERETHNNTSWDVAKFEVCAHKWADLSEGGYGVSLLNDCKYGHDIKDGVMRLTLIKSGTYPNPEADLGYHEFTYSIYPHGGTWREANTVIMAYNLNMPMYSRVEEPHKGIINDEMSLLKVDGDNCIVEVVKKAEDSNGVIIRLYEYKNIRGKVNITFGRDIETAHECDLMENIIGSCKRTSDGISFEIMPYEIKTFLIDFK